MSTTRTRTCRATAVLGVALAGLVVAAPAADAVTVKKVTMSSSSTFLPKTATVARGTVVSWHNGSFVTHTTTSNTGLWSARVAPGGDFRRTFTRAGTFRYHCTIHSGMTGTIVVQ